MIDYYACDTCGMMEIVHVCCVPGVPYSAGYCVDCLMANAHPWWVLASSVALCGGYLDGCSEELVEMVESTIKHLDRTKDEFLADVAEKVKMLEEMENEEPSSGELWERTIDR